MLRAVSEKKRYGFGQEPRWYFTAITIPLPIIAIPVTALARPVIFADVELATRIKPKTSKNKTAAKTERPIN